MDHKKEIELIQEHDEISQNVSNAIQEILYNPSRIAKHDCWKWTEENIREHLEKGARHILTYLIEQDGYQKKDGEDHLKLGICRCAMALSVRQRYQRKNEDTDESKRNSKTNL